ncbi:MAG: gliding motility-associated C-terminal domain-containing protein [Saprospiraceae bacterium]
MKLYTLTFLIIILGFSSNLFGQVTAEGDTISCFGASDGNLTITANSGQAPFTYFWQRNTGSPSGSGTIPIVGNTATINNLPAGIYDVTLVDGNSVNTITTATITSPPALTLNITAQTNNNCAGEANGSITVQGNGGYDPLEYSTDGINYQTSGTFNNLSSQTYIVRVRDSQGCITTINTTITEPTSGVGGFIQTQSNIACFGDSTGNFTIVGNGGLAPYLYSLDGGITQFSTGSFTNLPIGNYIVQIQDDLGCTFDLPVTLTEPSPILSNAVVINNATSPFNSNGSAAAGATGGVGNYTYVWDNGQMQSIATGLSVGIHCVTATDGNGCTDTACVAITSPPPIIITATDDVLSCFGDTGQSIITISGGTAPYAYGWANPITGTTGTGTILFDGGTDTIKNLTGGVWLVGVNDALNEQMGDTVFIVEPTELILSVSNTNVDCFGANNGSVTANVSGGTPPYTYNWSTTDMTPTVNGLTAGTYYVTVTDLAGCTKSDSGTIVAPSQQLQVFMSQTNISCNGANDGEAFTTIQGGIAPYTYQWSMGETTPNVANLSTGVVGVSITDAFGCSVTGTVNITQPFALSAVSQFVSDASCFGGDDASAVTIPNGGTTPYSYLWDNGQTAAFADSLIAGDHVVTITDANGCITVAAAVTVGEAVELVVMTEDTVVSCYGFNDGALVAYPSGGTGSYTYRWNSHPFADTFQVSAELFIGIYKVTVTDANGCTVIGVDTVTSPVPISATSSSTMTTCNDNFTNNGTATINISGGNGGYAYTWNNGDSTSMIDSIITGWYYVTVTDSIGCVYEDSVFVDAPPPITIADTSITLVSCFGGSDGTATIVPIGGTPPYDYEWQTIPTQTAPTATGLPIGWYSVVVNDANGCFLDTTNIYVRQPFRPLNAEISAFPPRCKDGSDGGLGISPATGGTAGYTYAWSTGDSTFNLFNVEAGNYNVTITDAKGCILIKDTIIENPERFYYNITTVPVTCFDGSDGQIIVDAAFGGAGEPFAYGFNRGLFQSDSIFVNLPPTTIAVAVRDGNGCEQDTIVTIPNAIELVVDVGSDQQIYLGDSSTIEALVNTNDPLSYIWTPLGDLSCDTCSNPNILPTQDEVIYTVMVEDSNGCTASDEIVISIIQQRNTFIPNGFTPNGDGINDIFIPFGGEGVVGIVRFQVYNRWGELVHSTTNFAPGDQAFGWDGYLTGNTEAPPAVYVFMVEYEFIDGKTSLYTGDVTLIR